MSRTTGDAQVLGGAGWGGGGGRGGGIDNQFPESKHTTKTQTKLGEDLPPSSILFRAAVAALPSGVTPDLRREVRALVLPSLSPPPLLRENTSVATSCSAELRLIESMVLVLDDLGLTVVAVTSAATLLWCVTHLVLANSNRDSETSVQEHGRHKVMKAYVQTCPQVITSTHDPRLAACVEEKDEGDPRARVAALAARAQENTRAERPLSSGRQITSNTAQASAGTSTGQCFFERRPPSANQLHSAPVLHASDATNAATVAAWTNQLRRKLLCLRVGLNSTPSPSSEMLFDEHLRETDLMHPSFSQYFTHPILGTQGDGVAECLCMIKIESGLVPGDFNENASEGGPRVVLGWLVEIDTEFPKCWVEEKD